MEKSKSTTENLAESLSYLRSLPGGPISEQDRSFLDEKLSAVLHESKKEKIQDTPPVKESGNPVLDLNTKASESIAEKEKVDVTANTISDSKEDVKEKAIAEKPKEEKKDSKKSR